jgi:ParG
MKKKIEVKNPPARDKEIDPEAMDQWVHGAAPAAVGSPRLRAPRGKPARLTIDLPPELHSRFKAACAINKTRMIDEVKAFIEDWTQKHS